MRVGVRSRPMDSRLDGTSRNWLILRAWRSASIAPCAAGAAMCLARGQRGGCATVAGLYGSSANALFATGFPRSVRPVMTLQGQWSFPRPLAPATAGGNPCSGDQRRTRSRRYGVENPCTTAGAGSVTMAGFRGNDVGGVPVCAVRTNISGLSGMTLLVVSMSFPRPLAPAKRESTACEESCHVFTAHECMNAGVGRGGVGSSPSASG